MMPHEIKIPRRHAENSGSLWTSLGNSQLCLPRVAVMRWDNLFYDLEAQLDTETELSRADIARDEQRRRRAEESLWQRLTAYLAESMEKPTIELFTDHGSLWITVDNFGDDWLAGDVTAPMSESGYTVISSRAVRGLAVPSSGTGMTQPDAQTDRSKSKRLGVVTFRIVLRDLARRRKSGWLCADTTVHHGQINSVGRDFLELQVSSHSHKTQNPREFSGLWLSLEAVKYFRLDG
ncbi:MAG: hypothetical protein RLZZ600_452 [Actinomycetota bacterium]